MIKVVSNAEMRQLDEFTINEVKIPGLVLMENAGLKTAMYIRHFIRTNKLIGPIHIYCGKGNNGGDGYVIARHFFNDRAEVKLFSVGDPENLKGDAKTNFISCKNLGVDINIINSPEQLLSSPRPAIIIDALLGTGISGAVEGLYKDVIHFINGMAVLVIAVDIPSGLNGDQATLPGVSVKADVTVTMALPKRAHVFYPARNFVGDLQIVKIGIPDSKSNSDQFKLNLVEEKDIRLPALREDTHKYSSGKLFILAGSPGMTGAAYLSAAAALRTGVGLINIGIPHSLNAIMEEKITEALTLPLPETKALTFSKDGLQKIEEKIDWADTVLIGPGIGRETETLEVVIETIKLCLKKNKPTLVDADALFVLSQNSDILKSLTSDFVLTPHHGEFLRFTNDDKEELISKPWEFLQKFLANKQFVLNLKGAPSMVGIPNGQVYINSTGNQGLAKGGSGDVLSGIIAGFMCRGMNAKNASIAGNYIHGLAAEELVSIKGITAMLPSDLLAVIPKILKVFESN
ncbi:NAD(P)H-hydrate dehydratase [Calditrichota bacterium]